MSRGPNSNLFGLGAAAGTVNVVPTQANVDRRSYSADVRFDSYGGHRESLNINAPLLPGKLALRIAGVNESKGFERKPSSERIDREFATILARPFKHTTIRATAERYHNENRRPNSITPRDTTAEWKAGGSPTWDPTTQMVTLANGTRSGPFPSDNAAPIPVVPGVTAVLPAFPAGLIGGYNGFYSRPMVAGGQQPHPGIHHHADEQPRHRHRAPDESVQRRQQHAAVFAERHRCHAAVLRPGTTGPAALHRARHERPIRL